MLTEEEAKTKVCHVTLGRHAQNGGYGQETNCLGSACMAWQSTNRPPLHFNGHYGHDEVEEFAAGYAFEIDMEKDASGKAGRYGYGRMVFKPSGYCGLAGKP